MGNPMSRNIMKAGFPLVAYDVKREAVEAVKKDGAKAASSLKELATLSKVIVTILPNSSIVRQVCLEEGGIFNNLGKQHTLIEMSTIDITLTRELAEETKARGVGFVDAPILGVPERVETRDVVIPASGDEYAVKECMEILQAIGKNVQYVGKAGNGKIVKLTSNFLVSVNKIAVTEAICLALKNGVDPKDLFPIIKISTGNSAVFERFSDSVLDSENKIAKKHSWHSKDLELVVDLATKSGAPLLIGSLAQAITRTSANASDQVESFDSLVKFYKKIMKLEK